ncbi:MAG: chromosomal replication initiator protein DnaA, partial [Thermoplasmata archaeon]|nr:chromosomal replication initiator protein DnaA [Thermoplasmata archaeon]
MASLYQRDDTPDRGRNALKKVWQDSYDESCVLELHARVDMDGLIRDYATAVLERPSKVLKKTKIPQAIDRSEAEKMMRAWKEKSYDVSSVESNLDAAPSVLTASLVAMREAVRKAEAISAILAGLDVSGFESRAAILRQRLHDPINHPDLDTEVESLKDAIESLQRIESRREVERVKERERDERTRKVRELAMNPPPEAASEERDVVQALEQTLPAQDTATNLVQTFTFESFTVGESNRFAHGAAVAVAKQPAEAYNPLLITSGPGLGKTHLLHAVGNYIAAHGKGANVLYLTCEAFASGLAEAKERGTLGAFRERVRGVRCLLLDDIQFLSGMPQTHEELFHTFNDLHTGERQIVLASDRPPKAIQNLDERLVSRFESGLVAGIEPPDLATRVTILEHRSRESKVPVDADVIRVIASLVENNVRELGGAFNRVVAFSSMMGRPITEELAREILSESNAEAPAERSAIREPVIASASNGLVAGHSYLIEEERPQQAFRSFETFLGG